MEIKQVAMQATSSDDLCEKLCNVPIDKYYVGECKQNNRFVHSIPCQLHRR